jgi:hypothetical protein
MPEGYTAAALAIKGPALYAGGKCGTEVLGTFAIDEPEPAWVPLPIPEQFRRHGKRVDDLIVAGDRLIAVDDMIIPQYLLLYDVSSPLRPALVEVRGLPCHTTCEQIERGALGASYLALLSSGVNHLTRTSHVALYERAGLGALGSLRVVTRTWGPDGEQQARTWHDVAWCGDVLLIAAGADGAGLLDLGTIGRPGPMALPPQCDLMVRYVSVPGGACVRLFSVPDTRLVLAVLDAGGRCDTVVLDVDALLAAP